MRGSPDLDASRRGRIRFTFRENLRGVSFDSQQNSFPIPFQCTNQLQQCCYNKLRSEEKKCSFLLLKKIINFFLLIVNSRKAILKVYIFFKMLFFTALINIMTTLVSIIDPLFSSGQNQMRDSHQICKYRVWVWCPGTFFFVLKKKERERRRKTKMTLRGTR